MTVHRFIIAFYLVVTVLILGPPTLYVLTGNLVLFLVVFAVVLLNFRRIIRGLADRYLHETEL